MAQIGQWACEIASDHHPAASPVLPGGGGRSVRSCRLSLLDAAGRPKLFECYLAGRPAL